MAKVKRISPEQFKSLPRNVRRDLESQREKAGLEPIDETKFRQKIELNLKVDKDRFNAALEVIEAKGTNLHDVIDAMLGEIISSGE